LVLGLYRHQVLALGLVELRSALQGQVDGFGRPRSPDQVLRVAAHQRRHLRARLLDRFLGFPAERVRTARRIAVVLGEERDHLLRHARIDRRGGGIVEVDRKLHYAAILSAVFSAVLPACFSMPRKSLITCICLPCWCETTSASVTEVR